MCYSDDCCCPDEFFFGGEGALLEQKSKQFKYPVKVTSYMRVFKEVKEI